MLSQRDVADHNWAETQVCNLFKTIELNFRFYKLGIWPKYLKDMRHSEYNEYCKMIELMLKKST
jgi:hypothetical protein